LGVTPSLPTMLPTAATPSAVSPTSTNPFPCLTGGVGTSSGC
jgi:hypothetical protein